MADGSLLQLVRASRYVERVKTTGILNPVLWLCGITLPASIIAALLATDQILRYVFAALAVVLVVFACVMYVIWSFRDPDRLQSEQYQLRKEELRHARKGQGDISTGEPDVDQQVYVSADDQLEMPNQTSHGRAVSSAFAPEQDQ